MILKKHWVLMLLLIFSILATEAQLIPRFTNFDFGYYAYCMVQDNRGYLWIGTDNGLIRYQGNNKLKTYVFDSRNPRSISSNLIWSVAIDRYNNVWIGTDRGLCRYQYNSDDFDVFLNNPNDLTSLSSNQVIVLAKDNSENLWAGVSDKGINLIVQKDSSAKINFKRFYHQKGVVGSFPVGNAWVMDFDANNNCWVGNYADGLTVFKPSVSDGKFIYRSFNTQNSALALNDIQRIYSDKHLGVLWILSPKGMLDAVSYTGNIFSDSSNIRFQHIAPILMKSLGLKAIFPFRIYGNDLGEYWMCTDSQGLIYFKIKTIGDSIAIDHAQQFSKFVLSKDSLQSNNLHSIYCDKAGYLWIGSFDATIAKLNPFEQLFQYGDSRPLLTAMKNENVYALTAQNDGSIWIGTNGANCLYQWKQSRCRKISVKDISNGLISNPLITYQIIIRKNGDLLAAGDYGLLRLYGNEILKLNRDAQYKINSKTGVLYPPEKILGAKQRGVFLCMHETPDSQLFLGTALGLFKINSDYSTSVPIDLNSGGSTRRIRTIQSMQNHLLVVGTDNGLVIYDYVKNRTVNISNFNNSDKSVFINYISTLAVNAKNEIIVGTSNGLYKINLEKSIVKLLALRDSKVCKVLVDEATSTIFASTQKGICRIDENGNTITFDVADGLFSNTLNDGAGVKLPDGSMMFGSVAGINRFNPDQLNSSIFKTPHLTITDFLIYNQSVLDEKNGNQKLKNAFLRNEILLLGEKENDITISFAAMNFYNENKNFFQYELYPKDENWVDNQNGNSVRMLISPRFNSWLFPGVYDFKIRTKTPGGKWIEASTPLRISMKPAFAKSIEFLSMLAISILATIVYIVRYLSQVRLKQQLAEQEKLLAVERERNRISRDLHDDLGAGLSSVAMMTNQMKQLVTDEQAQDRAWEISNEANDLVTRMREIIWSMSSKNDTVENLVAYINKYAFNYLEKNFIECKIIGEKNFPATTIDGDSRRNIFLVVKETLHNMVKHSGASEVILNYELHENKIQLNVCDNGKGFDMANIHRFGNGLMNMKQRMESVRGSYQINSEPGKGTETTLSIVMQ